MEGLSLRQLEDGVFKIVAPVLYKFKNLQAVELQDCNIYLQVRRERLSPPAIFWNSLAANTPEDSDPWMR